ncbi:hypothetical protein D3C86_2054470 [compost metagenome]
MRLGFVRETDVPNRIIYGGNYAQNGRSVIRRGGCISPSRHKRNTVCSQILMIQCPSALDIIVGNSLAIATLVLPGIRSIDALSSGIGIALIDEIRIIA